MRREQQPRARTRAGQIDDQVAGLRRQRDALVDVVEADGRRRHADFLQFVEDRRGDGRFLAGDPFHRQEPHQVLFGGLDVERNAGGSWSCYPSVLRLQYSIARLLISEPQGSPSSCQAANSSSPEHEHPDDIGQHQRDDRPDARVLVVLLGKPDDQREIGVERRDRVHRRIADPVGRQHRFGIDAQLHQQRHEDRREDRPFGDRPGDEQVDDRDDDDEADAAATAGRYSRS